MVRNLIDYYPVTQNNFVEEYVMSWENVQPVFLCEKMGYKMVHIFVPKNYI